MVKILLIVLASAVVFWVVAQTWPKVKAGFRGRILPLLVSPLAFVLLKRALWLLVRMFLFRR